MFTVLVAVYFVTLKNISWIPVFASDDGYLCSTDFLPRHPKRKHRI